MLGSSGTWVYDSGLKAGTQYPGGLRVVRTSQTAGQAVTASSRTTAPKSTTNERRVPLPLR